MFDLIEPDADVALDYLLAHRDRTHLFGFYHPASRHAALPRRCADEGIPFGIVSEAPCNMEGRTGRRLARHFYYRWMLPRRVAGVVASASLFANMSGQPNGFVDAIGWRAEQTLTFGYFPPALPGSRFVARADHPPAEMTVLLSGGHTDHRDPMTFMRALGMAAASGPGIRAIVCGEGPLTGEMQAFAARRDLAVEFRGMVPLDELVRLYETADLFVAPGANEPWGIRVNDALNCGCPVLVSSGMGASVIVEQFGSGAVFRAGDAAALAALLVSASAPDRWSDMVRGTAAAARHITPAAAADRLGRFIDDRLALAGRPGRAHPDA
ncbi:glycosyltransferase [Emcibacter sp. SYSU 3D8]|uniref:glycosyltransferase n=1 Tax=Emcibacter sp. SYSU 3D8 TaxID=3133969 RepID=UPI0031FE5AEC